MDRKSIWQVIVMATAKNAKAIVALVCTILYSMLGLDVPLDVQTAVTALFVALAVWLIPNSK